MNHVALDSFGDLDCAANDPHVVGCGQCRAELVAQQEVRAALSNLPDPGPLPDDLMARLGAALDALPPITENGVSEAPVHRTVVPLDAERARRHPRRPWLAAAAAVVVMGAGGYVVHDLAPEGRSASSASTALEPRASLAPDGSTLSQGVLVSSGTSYTRAQLSQQVGAVLNRRVAPLAGIASPGSVSVAQCLRAIDASAATPLLADVALFEGQPVLVLVVRTQAGAREVWVVARSCRPGQDGLRYYEQLR